MDILWITLLQCTTLAGSAGFALLGWHYSTVARGASTIAQAATSAAGQIHAKAKHQQELQAELESLADAVATNRRMITRLRSREYMADRRAAEQTETEPLTREQRLAALRTNHNGGSQ